MPKQVNILRIKATRSYTIVEAAEVLRVSVGTVRQWVRKGLPIMKARRPFLIAGGDLRSFHAERWANARPRLKDDEFKCFGCKQPRKPLGGMVDCIPQTPLTCRLVALCEVCGKPCHRIVSRANLSTFHQIFAVEMREPRGA